MSIPFTYQGKASLLRVTGLCLVSPPPPFPSVRVLRPLELAWRQDFPLGTIIMVFMGYRQQSFPPSMGHLSPWHLPRVSTVLPAALLTSMEGPPPSLPHVTHEV